MGVKIVDYSMTHTHMYISIDGEKVSELLKGVKIWTKVGDEKDTVIIVDKISNFLDVF